MRKVLVVLSVLTMAAFALACVISDYDGIGGHQTTGDAKLWGKEVAFTGFAPDLDGTYSYVVSYNNNGGAGNHRIDSLLNANMVSFSRDGVVDRDGDDVQGNSGSAGGKFLPQFVAVDGTRGSCGFFGNVTQDKSSTGPLLALCINGATEEIDKDHSLRESFRSLDSFLKQVWSGALTGRFTLDVTAVRINGAVYPVESFSVAGRTTALSAGRWVIDGSQPAAASVIQTILANTNHGEAVSFGLNFDGGMTVQAPAGVKIAFHHDRLAGLLN